MSGKYRVNVVPPPRTTVNATLTYPAYTRVKPRQTEMLSFEALEGSRAEWTLKADRPLEEAQMIVEGGQPLAMKLSPDRMTATAGMVAEKQFSYGFSLKDREHGFVYAPDVRYSVQVVPDRPPRVTLVSPARDEIATVRRAVDVAFIAKDDYGLSAARIVCSIESKAPEAKAGPEQIVNIRTFEKQETEVSEKYRWQLLESIPDLKPGDVIRYSVEMLDNRSGLSTPGMARSEARRLTIVSPEEYVRLATEERMKLLSRIKDLHGEETKATEAVKDLGGVK